MVKKNDAHRKLDEKQPLRVGGCFCWLGILMTATTRHVLLSRVWFVKVKWFICCSIPSV